jgi:hypothetical protein
VPDLTPIVATAGPWGLVLSIVAAVLTLLLRGDLVPRKVYEDMRSERNLQRERGDRYEASALAQNDEVRQLLTELARSMRPHADTPGAGT